MAFYMFVLACMTFYWTQDWIKELSIIGINVLHHRCLTGFQIRLCTPGKVKESSHRSIKIIMFLYNVYQFMLSKR